MTEGIDTTIPPSGTGCVECMAAQPIGWWFHLRRCASCGHIGCCNASPSQHAQAHFVATSHRYIQSYEPGETWFWDFEDEQSCEGPELQPPNHHPLDQDVPGPRRVVPADWVALLHQ